MGIYRRRVLRRTASAHHHDGGGIARRHGSNPVVPGEMNCQRQADVSGAADCIFRFAK